MKKSINILLSFLLLLSVLSGCGMNAEKNNAIKQIEQGQIGIISTNQNAYDIHSKKQQSFLNHSNKTISFYAKGKKELSEPEITELTWHYNSEEKSGKEYTVNISEFENMSDAMSYTSSSESLGVTNLKIASSYYWTVSVDGKTTEKSEFKTSGSAPRNISVDGVTNMRDLGGWETESGTRTKQGLIYRCGRLNESSAEAPNIEISDSGIKTMCEELKIKTEIDLRRVDTGETGHITSSPLGGGVNYINCPMDWQGDMFTANKEELVKLFAVLADENNYPVIFHCNIGTDRTGMVAYLVNALLGVSEEDLLRDYLFSNFGNIGSPRKESQMKESGYYDAVRLSDGESLSEKAYNCLLGIGVSAEQLDSIISILS